MPSGAILRMAKLICLTWFSQGQTELAQRQSESDILRRRIVIAESAPLTACSSPVQDGAPASATSSSPSVARIPSIRLDRMASLRMNGATSLTSSVGEKGERSISCLLGDLRQKQRARRESCKESLPTLPFRLMEITCLSTPLLEQHWLSLNSLVRQGSQKLTLSPIVVKSRPTRHPQRKEGHHGTESAGRVP